MAAGFLKQLAGDNVQVLSAGIDPTEAVNPVVTAAMIEKGIDLSSERPKALTESAVRQADVIITMNCRDACPVYAGKRYEEWEFDHAGAEPIEQIRWIRDQMEDRVRGLVEELLRPR
jgi:protein-tyrosine-phosphatase